QLLDRSSGLQRAQHSARTIGGCPNGVNGLRRFRSLRRGCQNRLNLAQTRSKSLCQRSLVPFSRRLGYLAFFSILAQLSFRATVRLNTDLPGFESVSTQK